MALRSRRSVLISAGLAAGLGGGCGVLGSKDCGTMPSLPRVSPGAVLTWQAPSERGRLVAGLPRAAGRDVSGLSVVLMLHGSSGDARTQFDRYGVQYYLPTSAGFAMVAMDHWDPLSRLANDLLPFLRDKGFRTERVGIIGWSIGGRAALLLAARLGPTRVAAVAATSPALDPADVPALGRSLDAIPTYLACGRSDGFADPTADLLSRLRRASSAEVSGGLVTGCHDTAIRRRMLPAQLPFFVRHIDQNP